MRQSEPIYSAGLALAPDGEQLAYQRTERDAISIWIMNLRGRMQPRRLTLDPGGLSPLWTPDSLRLVFRGVGGLFMTRADGSGKRVRLMEEAIPRGFTPDGRKLVYTPPTALGAAECFIATLEGDPDAPAIKERQPCFSTTPSPPGGYIDLRLSPDGRWLAYTALVSGTEQVFISAVPDQGGRWQISTDRGIFPRWSWNGRQLFYLGADNRLKIATLDFARNSVVATSVQDWSDKPFWTPPGYIPGPDGRLLIPEMEVRQDKRATQVEMLFNFAAEAKRRVEGTTASN